MPRRSIDVTLATSRVHLKSIMDCNILDGVALALALSNERFSLVMGLGCRGVDGWSDAKLLSLLAPCPIELNVVPQVRAMDNV